MISSRTSAIEIMNLRQIDAVTFEGDSEDLGFHQLFGGQVLGQCLVAAGKTLPAELLPHSLHAYFLRPGTPDLPVMFKVTSTRNGSSFATRQVDALQSGNVIFCAIASFQRHEEGPTHQCTAPVVQGPEGLETEVEHMRRIKSHIPDNRREQLIAERTIELRIVNRPDPLHPKPQEPFRNVWLKSVAELPNQPLLHTALLAYASDFGISMTGLLPHGLSVTQPNVQVASLDHAIWFHRPCQIESWLLYTMESSTAASGRSFNRGQIFSKDGKLVASVAQEALLRLKSRS